MIGDDAASGTVVTGTHEKVVSTVATKIISRSDRTKVSKNKDGVHKREQEQLANRLRSFLTIPSSTSDTVTQDTSASSGNPRWRDGTKVQSDSVAAQDNEDVSRDQDQHRDQQQVHTIVREVQTMLTPTYWGKPSDWPEDPQETSVASEPVLESVNEERRSERIATARTQELVAQTISRVTIEHLSRQMPEEEEWMESESGQVCVDQPNAVFPGVVFQESSCVESVQEGDDKGNSTITPLEQKQHMNDSDSESDMDVGKELDESPSCGVKVQQESSCFDDAKECDDKENFTNASRVRNQHMEEGTWFNHGKEAAMKSCGSSHENQTDKLDFENSAGKGTKLGSVPPEVRANNPKPFFGVFGL